MIRQHQFEKVELVSITTPEASRDEHERMLACAEAVLKKLDLALPRGDALHRRHGLRVGQDLRHRGLAAGAGRVSRDLLLLELRRLPGAAHGRPLPAEGRQGRPRFVHTLNGSGVGGRPRAGRRPGDLPERGRLDRRCRTVLRPYMGGLARIEKASVMASTHAHPHHQRRRHPCAPGSPRWSGSPARSRTTSGSCAPETDQSGVAHSLSLNDPLRLREVGERRYRRSGTPTDCVIMGVRHHAAAPAGPRALRRQSRPEHRRGRDLFGHHRRRHGGHAPRHPVDRPVAGLWAGRPRRIRWDCAEAHAPGLIVRLLAAGIGEGHALQHQLPGLRARRGEGHRGHGAGPARPGTAAARRAASTAAAIPITGSPSRAAPMPPTAPICGRWPTSAISVTPLKLDLDRRADDDHAMPELFG